MDEDRFDVMLVGVDPTRPRDEVIAGLARRLVKSADEIEALLTRGPSPVLRSVAARDVPGLLDELRDLGARVKRQEARPLVPPEASEAPETIELLGASRVAEPEAPETPEAPAPEPAPTERVSAEAPTALAIAAPVLPEAQPTDARAETADAPPSPPAPLEIRPDAPWLAPKSLPEGTFSRERSPKVAPTPLTKPVPSAARRGRAEKLVTLDPPAHLFDELPRALRAPFGRAIALPLALAPLLGTLALALVTWGLRNGEELGPLGVALGTTAAAGFVGLLLQLAASALAATASARPAQPLPPRLVPDYLAPGARLLVGEGALVGLAFFARDRLAAHADPRLASGLVLAMFGIYATLTLVLVVASGTTLSLLDATHAGTLVRRGGVRTLLLLGLGGVPLVLGVLGALTVVDMAIHARTLRVVVADVAILGTTATAAITLGAVYVGSFAALLVRIRE